MQLRHAPVRDQDHAQGGQARQAAEFYPRKLEAFAERILRESLQCRDRDTDCPLPVVHRDPGFSTRRLTCFFHFTGARFPQLFHGAIGN